MMFCQDGTSGVLQRASKLLKHVCRVLVLCAFIGLFDMALSSIATFFQYPIFFVLFSLVWFTVEDEKVMENESALSV